jgi:UDP-N-acetylmuramate: L-alanyl-gamma-D-glutamyl-meso-diaminopimelate ligase
MESHDTRRVYLMGIGGIGMVNVAALLSEDGWQVAGSDDTMYPPASELLERLPVTCHTPYRAENLPEGWPIVVGNALSRGHVEVETALARDCAVFSFPEFLRHFVLPGKKRIVVAGTHGKTTTAACIAYILERLGKSPSFLVGGQPRDFQFGGHRGRGKWIVLEGDEYDSAFFDKRSKFLHYFPHVLTLGRIEYDHADIFPSLDDIKRAFRLLLRLLPSDGLVIACGDDPTTREIAEGAPCRVVWVGETESNDWQLLPDTDRLRWQAQGRGEGEAKWSIFGKHNRLNGLMAVATVIECGYAQKMVTEAIDGFSGVQRRLEQLLETEALVVIDDFAHHPTAVASAIEAVREQYPGRRLVAVFEPRSNTAVRRYLQDELADALSGAEVSVVGTIHREAQIAASERLDTAALGRRLSDQGRTFAHIQNEAIPDWLMAKLDQKPTAVLFMSNGNFSGIQRRFTDIYLGQEKVEYSE